MWHRLEANRAKKRDVSPLSILSRHSAESSTVIRGDSLTKRRESATVRRAQVQPPEDSEDRSGWFTKTEEHSYVEDGGLEDEDLVLPPFFTSSEQLERKKRAFRRFRGLIRVITLVRSKFQTIEEIKKEEASKFPFFDVDYYSRKNRVQTLPQKVKNIMACPKWQRTEEENNLVLDHLLTLNCFDKYPPEKMAHMAQSLHYQSLGPNRVVVRQGHMPVNFYLVLSGHLRVHREQLDKETGLMVYRQLSTLKMGTSFGEIALVNGIPRTATVSTTTNTELLWMDKSDFDQFLQMNVEPDWTLRFQAMRSLAAFKSGWAKEDLSDCCNYAQLVGYKKNQTILGDTHGRPDFLYFIVSGQCHLVEILHIIRDSSTRGGIRFKMAPTSKRRSEDGALSTKTTMIGAVVRRYIQILELDKGRYFGAGEDLHRRCIIASSKVECLLIPHFHLRRRGFNDWVEMLQDKLQASLPSHTYVFEEFVKRASWRAYKKHMAELHKCSPKRTSAVISDVPLSIQIAEKTADRNNMLDISEG